MTAVNFVSLISRDDRPLYIQLFDVAAPSDDGGVSKDDANKFLKYNFLSHMALDVFSSPMSLNLREQQQQQKQQQQQQGLAQGLALADGILLLFIQDEVMVYGMETNNGLKIVVGLSSGEPLMTSLKTLFSSLYKCYLKTICNPFTDLQNAGSDEILQSPRFDLGVKGIVELWKGGAVAA